MKKVGIIGCGNIAETYFRAQEYFNNINIIACADINNKVSKNCAKEYNIKSQSVEEILLNPEIFHLQTCRVAWHLSVLIP